MGALAPARGRKKLKATHSRERARFRRELHDKRADWAKKAKDSREVGKFYRYALREHEERAKPLVLVECGVEGVTTYETEQEVSEFETRFTEKWMGAGRDKYQRL